MLNVRPAQDEPNLLQVSQDMGRLLADAIRAASVVPTFFSQVAANVLRIATQRFAAQGYEQPLRSAFVRHGVLPPGPAFAVAATQPMPMAAAAAEPTTLQQVRLSVAEYGLGVPSVLVYAASEPKRSTLLAQRWLSERRSPPLRMKRQRPSSRTCCVGGV